MGNVLINFASAIHSGNMGVYIQENVIEYLGKYNSTNRVKTLGWSFFDQPQWETAISEYRQINVIKLIIDSNFGYSSYPNIFQIKAHDYHFENQ